MPNLTRVRDNRKAIPIVIPSEVPTLQDEIEESDESTSVADTDLPEGIPWELYYDPIKSIPTYRDRNDKYRVLYLR